MRLRTLKVQNWRGYQNEFEIEFSDFTAIIGRNDVGKSALLDALALFFEQSKGDGDDACRHGDPANIDITCVFEDLPSKIVIDTSVETNLADEHLLNSEGYFEVTKTYNGTSKTAPRITSISAKAMHPSNEGTNDLHSLKRTELVARATELGVNLSNVNKTRKAELRSAIWSQASDNKKSIQMVDLQKEGGKDVWAEVSKSMPSFWLFKSDRASTDKDSEAQDPLNAAISEAVKDVEGKFEEIRTEVEGAVTRVAELTLEKLREMEPEIAQSLEPKLSSKKLDTLFATSITGDDNVPLNKRGSGVRRLVLLSFFRAKVEKEMANGNQRSIIYAIEEPETSQHPNYQRMIISTLQELTADSSRQVIITTHSPMLARTVAVENLKFIRKAGANIEIHPSNENLEPEIAQALGVLPDHNVKLFVGVEGPNDIAFLKGISRMLSDRTDLPDLELLEAEGELIFVPMGGSNLGLWSNKLKGLNRPELHICDRDNNPPQEAKYQDHTDIINARDGCQAFITDKREMENYIHPDAIRGVYQDSNLDIEIPNSFEDFDNVPEIVARAVHVASGSDVDWNELEEKKRAQKRSRAKYNLNTAAVRKMTHEQLAAVDINNEISNWLNVVTEMKNRN